MFITFEGGEGSGKSTQAKLLQQALEKQGKTTILTREPGGGEPNGDIRKLLVEKDHNWHNKTEILLHMASRNENLEKIVYPALKQNKIVICDRYLHSTIAYQCYGSGADLDFILNLHKIITNNFLPSITFFLDVPASIGLKRSTKRIDSQNSNENFYELKGLEYHEKVRNGFLQIAQQNPQMFKKIDASKSIEEIHQEILESLEVNLK